MIAASSLISEARKLLGTPFHHQGRNEFGVDCMGLVLLAAHRAGGDILAAAGLEDARDYGRGINANALELLATYCARRVEAPRPAALIVFRYQGEPLPRHQGLYTAEGTIIHADGFKHKRVVEDRYAGIWVKRAHSFWLLHGVEYGA